MEYFNTPAQTFAKGWSAYRHDHEFLKIDFIIGMRTTIQDIHHGNGDCAGIGTTDIAIQWQRCLFGSSLGSGHTHCKQGIGTQFTFIGRTIELYHKLINA